MKQYKWIIWFPKKWERHTHSSPSVLYGYLDGEIFISNKYLFNTDIESESNGFTPIDERFKEKYYYEFFDSKDDVVILSKELQREKYKIKQEFQDKMENFYSKTSLKKMKNKIREAKLKQINEQIYDRG